MGQLSAVSHQPSVRDLSELCCDTLLVDTLQSHAVLKARDVVRWLIRVLFFGNGRVAAAVGRIRAAIDHPAMEKRIEDHAEKRPQSSKQSRVEKRCTAAP